MDFSISDEVFFCFSSFRIKLIIIALIEIMG